MGLLSHPKGSRIRLTVEGYLVYSMGGYTRLAVAPVGLDDDPPRGEVVEICDVFVTDTEVRPLFDDNTLFENPESREVWRYGTHPSYPDRPWLSLDDGKRYTQDQIGDGWTKWTRLYREGEV